MSEYYFEHAPLDEVIFSIDFGYQQFPSVYFGLYWSAIRERFPNYQTERVPFVTAQDERAQEGSSIPDLPPLRRVWFQDANGCELIQLQAGRYMYNWRKRPETTSYPEFEGVYARFCEEWGRFSSWFSNESGHAPNMLRAELAYVNKLDAEHGWSTTEDASALLTFVNPPWGEVEPPRVVSALLQFQVTDLGMMHVITRPYHGADTSAVNQLEFRLISDLEKEPTLNWFKDSREAISRYFLKMTTDSAHALWGRRRKDLVHADG